MTMSQRRAAELAMRRRDRQRAEPPTTPARTRRGQRDPFSPDSARPGLLSPFAGSDATSPGSEFRPKRRRMGDAGEHTSDPTDHTSEADFSQSQGAGDVNE